MVKSAFPAYYVGPDGSSTVCYSESEVPEGWRSRIEYIGMSKEERAKWRDSFLVVAPERTVKTPEDVASFMSKDEMRAYLKNAGVPIKGNPSALTLAQKVFEVLEKV